MTVHNRPTVTAGAAAAVMVVVVAVGLLFAVAPVGARAQTTVPTQVNPPVTCEIGPPPEYARICTSTKVVEMPRPPRSNWPPFLAVVAWVLVPLGLAAYIAASRDQSVVIAVVLTVVLGWIGLALVYAFLGRGSGREGVSRPVA